MSLPESLPSLFGRFTAIMKDHDHLGTTLRELKALCFALQDGRRDLPHELEPQRLFTTLLGALRHHFAAEESDNYFGTVVTENPQLQADIAALKVEHASMLRAVEWLVQLASKPENWAGLPEPTRRFVTQLERHEGSESKLLRSFFFSQG